MGWQTHIFKPACPAAMKCLLGRDYQVATYVCTFVPRRSGKDLIKRHSVLIHIRYASFCYSHPHLSGLEVSPRARTFRYQMTSADLEFAASTHSWSFAKRRILLATRRNECVVKSESVPAALQQDWREHSGTAVPEVKSAPGSAREHRRSARGPEDMSLSATATCRPKLDAREILIL